jgi:hypothetical protein
VLLTTRRIKQLQAQGSLPTQGVKVLVAGLAHNTSQKLHNMIYAIERVDEAAELVLMLDDDMLMVRAPPYRQSWPPLRSGYTPNALCCAVERRVVTRGPFTQAGLEISSPHRLVFF